MKKQIVAALAVLSVLGAAPAPAVVTTSRDVTLATSKDPVVYGSGFILTGRVTTSDGSEACRDGVEVVIIRDFYDDHPYDWAEVVRVTTDDTGRFRAALMAENSAMYRARIPAGTTPCEAARSSRVRVRSRVSLTLGPTTATVQRGERVRLRASAFPRCDSVIYLEKLVDGRFVRVASAEPNERCVATFRRRMHHDSVFRAHHPEVAAPGFFYLGNRSSLTAVTVAAD